MRRISKHVLIIALIVCLFIGHVFLASTPVYACSCAERPPPEEAKSRAFAVFRGTVVGSKAPAHPRAQYTPRFKLRVDEVWKGSVHETMYVYTHMSQSSCGYRLILGWEYIIYAYGDENRLEAHVCTRTRGISSAQEDLDVFQFGSAQEELDAFGQGSVPKPGSMTEDDYEPGTQLRARFCSGLSKDASLTALIVTLVAFLSFRQLRLRLPYLKTSRSVNRL